MNKNVYKMILLGGLSLIALAGCQKGLFEIKGGREVQFTASSAPQTKAVYGGTSGSYQRIDWEAGDQIIIFSDKAETPEGDKSYTYVIREGSITTSGATSKAKLDKIGETGLRYLDDVDGPYKFAGVFPTSGFSFTEDGKAKVNCIVPTEQTILESGFPTLGSALMLADPVSVEKETAVSLNFRPLFTTLDFTVGAEKDMKITGFMVKSEAVTVGETTFGPSTLNGEFDCIIDLNATNPAWDVDVQLGDSRYFIQATFPTPLQVTADGDPVHFAVYTVPTDLTALSFIFNVQFEEGGQTKNETRTMKVTYAKSENNHSAGDPVTFDGGKKHNITGVTIPANMSKEINLELSVIEWDDETGTITYGPDAVVNALALEYAKGAAKTSGSDRRWANNFANNTDPIEAYFSVYSPQNANWKIKVTGATNKLLVTADNATSTTTDDGLELTGATGGRVHFTITRATGDNAPTDSDEIKLNFFVVLNGREISMNSEITRKNELTITGKVGN